MEDMIAGAISLNKEKTAELKTTLQTFGEILKSVCESNLTDIRVPVIAGGAVRDTLFGIQPRDFDIFFDVSQFTPDEAEDVVLLVGTYVMEELRKLPQYSHVANVGLTRNGGNYTEGSPSWKEGQFIVYSTPSWANNIAWEEPYNADRYTPLVIQFIGHADKRLSENPVSFLDYFDWALTKALYDPLDQSFTLHPEFKTVVDAKEVTPNNQSEWSRIDSWIERFKQRNIYPPIKINTSKVMPNGLSTTSIGSTTPTNDILRFNLLAEWEGIRAVELRLNQANEANAVPV